MGMEKRARLKALLEPASTARNVLPSSNTAEPQFVRCRSRALVSNARPVRFIAFHLPQYHEIPENNQWWGKGFTEWSNVRSAQPLFPGHYQPHIPLQGYYDLSDSDAAVLPRQAELAKKYGIEGFCFYFYWFQGHRLLETPLLDLLHHEEWDVPFCLCWANENWTRRWDGLEQDVLIAQDYSPADDLAFIEYISKYLIDPRYIRVGDRPLLLLYRPDLLPAARDTVERWRNYCRKHGIGEIFVAYPQSFECRDPREYGMDAAVEFPPNNSAPPQLSPASLGCDQEFGGAVYDWSVFPERAKGYTTPTYPLFRGLNPGWDNTPRRKERATIFLHNNATDYQEWALLACRDTIRRIPEQEDRLVFINAWNEWGEGAHLEPDLQTGCAYLEATDMAQIRAGILEGQSVNPTRKRVAVVVHAFYPDIFAEMLPQLQQIPKNLIEIWISTPKEQVQGIEQMMAAVEAPYHVLGVENRGRDVLPFLTVLPHLLAQSDIGYILKLHTKKSVHRKDGAAWRRKFYDQLLCEELLDQWIQAMEEDRHIGMYAPKDYVVPMSLFWGSNARKVVSLAERLGIRKESLSGLSFVAGTMFFCRLEVMLPIHALDLSANDFEEECGQVDGTYAHALERAFGISCHGLEMSIVGV
jgi:lipopolysaccharide biosynthesis protein